VREGTGRSQGELFKVLARPAQEQHPEGALKTPVTFIIFKRPDLTARVWEAIRRARPAKLFVIADGPRTPQEEVKCDETRKVVEQIDWPCEVQRNYSATNLGCRERIASGLDWVFSQMSEAIILEDDCLPSPSFFDFAAELLGHYREEPRVMHICGSNFVSQEGKTPYSYYFSRYAHVWGWATWARAWNQMDLSMKEWPEFSKSAAATLFADPLERKHWLRKLNRFFTGERSDSWAYPWQFAVWAHNGVCVSPATNLVSNIGHRADATHTQTGSPRANLAAGEVALPLKHPPAIRIDEHADRLTFYEALEGDRLRQRQSLRYRLSKPLRVWRKLRGMAFPIQLTAAQILIQ
jgi:hypothetical protein